MKTDVNILRVCFLFELSRKCRYCDLRSEISRPQPLREFLGAIPMNAKMLADFLNTYRFLRCVWCCEYQLRQTRCDETQLNKPIDAFPRFDAIGIEAEVLFGISKRRFYLPPLSVVFDDLRNLKRQICCKDAEVPIRF